MTQQVEVWAQSAGQLRCSATPSTHVSPRPAPRLALSCSSCAPTPRRLHGGPADGRSTGMPGRLKIANRGVLAGALVRTCLAQHSGNVQFHFEQVGRGWK